MLPNHYALINSYFDEESTYYDSTAPSSLYRVQDNYISKGALTSYYDKDYYQFTTSSNYSYTVAATATHTTIDGIPNRAIPE